MSKVYGYALIGLIEITIQIGSAIWDILQNQSTPTYVQTPLIIQEDIYVDSRGYERDRNNLDEKNKPRLVHRTVAYREIYDHLLFDKPFREYVVHHLDENKRNNNVNNLQILTWEQHNKIHAKQSRYT